MKKCNQCDEYAEVQFNWPSSRGGEEMFLCGGCASFVWNKLSTEFNGTEAYLGFSCKDCND